MKYPIIILFIGFLQPAIAQDDHGTPADIQNYIGYGAILLILFVFIIVLVVLLRTFNILAKIILKLPGYIGEKPEFINDNQSFFKPAYFLYGGIAIILICTFVYLIGYQNTDNQINTLKTEGIVKLPGSKVNEVKSTDNSSEITLGSAIFVEKCSACHGAQGQGVVGPNLTDDYWIHGGKIADLSKSINNGYPEKGMPAWGKILSSSQISNVIDFIKSLKGTNPLNAKAPQGIKEL
jgi:cytochrome c oxidase cbb3-type subunit 3